MAKAFTLRILCHADDDPLKDLGDDYLINKSYEESLEMI